MDTFLLKLLLTPTLIGAVSLAGRRWGSAISGWLVGLPLNSAPIALFLALDHGAAFATSAATGTLAGALSDIAFCLLYCWLALRHRWPLPLAVSTSAFLLISWLLHFPPLAAIPVFVAVVVCLAISLHLLPRLAADQKQSVSGWWDIPARMILATLFVIVLTAIAPALGPQLSGLLATYPMYITILATFTHAGQGAGAAIRLVRGALLGIFSLAAFFLVVTLLLERAGIFVAFGSATVAALCVQGIVLRAV